MLRAIILVVLALAWQVDAGIDSNRLYDSVYVGDFDSAVNQSKTLRHRNDVIVEVVERLLNESKRNVIDYAYALWTNDAQNIVKNNFPHQIRSIVGRHKVKIIGYRDNMVLKLGVRLDRDGDRECYGDGDHLIGDRMVWEFRPVTSSQLYFKIYNPLTNQYLMLGSATDRDGDHTVYGNNKSGTYRHHWFLYPVKYQEELLFYIFNREYNQAIKLSREVDLDNDRTAYSENGNVFGEPFSFGWKIAPL